MSTRERAKNIHITMYNRLQGWLFDSERPVSLDFMEGKYGIGGSSLDSNPNPNPSRDGDQTN